MNNTPRS